MEDIKDIKFICIAAGWLAVIGFDFACTFLFGPDEGLSLIFSSLVGITVAVDMCVKKMRNYEKRPWHEDK